jgi:hypothetical protein
MKRWAILFLVVIAAVGGSVAAPLGSSARTAIPFHVQQIISVDYRALRNSESGMALKARVLPDNLKQFEQGLRGMGLDPDKDVEQLAFVAFRVKNSLASVGLAQGSFDQKKFIGKMKLRKVKAEKYRLNDIYPTGTGLVLSFLDPTTMVFGDSGAVKRALDARDGEAESVGTNGQVNDLIANVEDGAVWSVLDQAGTQNMMHSALGEAASLADYEFVKKRLLGSRYTVDFARGVNFDLDVVTADSMTAATLSSLLKAGMMFKRSSASAAEKTAMESMTVDNSNSDLQVHFKADDRKFQSLLETNLFAAVSR